MSGMERALDLSGRVAVVTGVLLRVDGGLCRQVN